MTRWLLALLLLPSPAWAQFPQPWPDQIVTTSLTATGTLVLTTSGYAQVNLQATGTGSGLTFAVRGTMDGTTWQTLPCVVPTTPGTFVTSMSANGYWSCPAAAWKQVELNLSAIGGGTETFVMEASVRSNMNIGQ